MALTSCEFGPGRVADEECYREFLKALLAGDCRRCTALVVEQRSRGRSIPEIYERLFQRALYRVGELWERNHVSVATEHLATGIVEGLLSLHYAELAAAERIGRRVVVGAVEGDLHRVGARMVCDVFESHGWDSLYLGAGTPIEDLLRLLRDQPPDAVGLSVSSYMHLPALMATLSAIRRDLPRLPVLVGGLGLYHGGATLLSGVEGVRYLAGLGDVARYARRWPQAGRYAARVGDERAAG